MYSFPSMIREKPEMKASSGIRKLNLSSTAVSAGLESFSSTVVMAYPLFMSVLIFRYSATGLAAPAWEVASKTRQAVKILLIRFLI